jgi:phage/plasmid-associated DNA primase
VDGAARRHSGKGAAAQTQVLTPGTHNTKGGKFLPVTTLTLTDVRYELDDIEEWLAETSPVILRKVRPTAAPIDDNPFTRAAALLGFKPSVDVEKRLQAMSYMGVGDASIHATQLAVSASLLNSGHSPAEVTDILTSATRAAAGEYGARWNWRREEKAIERMCATWLAKHPQPLPRPKPATRTSAAEGGNVVSMADAAAAVRKLAKPSKSNVAVHIVLGEAVIAAVRQRGDDLAFTPRSAWRYTGGLWSLELDGLKAWLDMEIETACRELNIDSTNKVVGEARQWIMRNPTLWREDIKWDAHGKVPCRSGLIDPSTLKVEPPAASHYSTWRIECDYTPLADCPWWTTMINDLFDDRAPTSRAKHIDVVQECLGAALVDIKPRALAKALIFQGGSNFGKSGILEVLGGLFGENQIATPLIALEGSHGLMPFTKRLPWVLHEAFDQGKWHFSSAVKAIITGEPVSINIKNGPMLSQRVKAPIFWGTNSPPQFREATKAIINRMIVIECRREFIEGQPIGAAAEAFKRGYDKPSSLVLTEEMPGLLNWALTGLQRALVRQHIELTDDIRNTSNEIRRDSNLVAGFLEECAGFDPERMVSIPDFCAAFSVWWVENKGEDRRMPSNEAVSKSLIAMSDPRIAINSQELRANSRRYYAGIVLNDQGLGYHKRANEAKAFEGKVASTTANDGVVNSLIPETWNSKASIIAMRSRQGGDGSLNGHFQTVTSTQTVTENLSPVTHVSPALSPTEKSAMSTAPRF